MVFLLVLGLGKRSKAIGVVLLLYGLFCFLVNFGVWKPPFVGDVHVLWNPIDAVCTGSIVGGIPLIAEAIAVLLRYVFALIYSAVVGFVGLFFVLH